VNDFGDLDGAAIVTGGSGGLGAAVCRLLATRGSDVALTYRGNEDAARAVAGDVEAAGRRATVTRIDLLDADACAAFVAQVAEECGGVHTLVHAAGPLVQQRYLGTVPPAEFREHLDQECAGFFNVVHPVLPHLRTTSGSIVAVTTAGTRRYPLRDGLSAGTKAAIESIVRALAAEEGRYGVRANMVGPGMTMDGMAPKLVASGDLHPDALDAAMRNIPLRRFGDAEDIAEAVCFLASPRADYISGQKLDVDGGFGV
jgi:3-oxoacyl-[acyl-carrier protein] reductase